VLNERGEGALLRGEAYLIWGLGGFPALREKVKNNNCDYNNGDYH